MRDVLLALNLLREFSFKSLQPVFFFIHILDQSPSTIDHLIQAILHALLDCLILTGLRIELVWLVPNVMSDEFFHLFSQTRIYQVFSLVRLDCVYNAIDVFNKDIVTSDHHFLLLLVLRIGLVVL